MELLPPIAALSTPFGKGAIAMLRLSGEGCSSVIERVFEPASGRFETRKALYGRILDPTTGETLDDGVLTLYRAPHSYTGEDMAELCCHGGPVISGLVLRALLDAGARMAQPGEFTRRAFAGGKLSLSRAEGIADLIDARTDAAARLAHKEAAGALSEKLSALSEELTALSAGLCVSIDYAEQGIPAPDYENAREKMRSVSEALTRLLNTLSLSRALTEGVETYIVGRVNVGKSSFFNALLGEERAIVTDIPGTTRDLLEYPLQAGRVLLRLTDTAGLRKTGETVEQIGIERVYRKLRAGRGFLLFGLFDLGEYASNEDRELVSFLQEMSACHTVIPVLTKTDKPECFDRSIVAPLGEPFCVSLLSAPDFAPLFERIEKAYIEDEDALWRGEVLSNLRQYDCVKRALSALSEAKEHLNEAQSDICVTLLEEAIGALLQADGREVADRVAEEIFRRFCVGK